MISPDEEYLEIIENRVVEPNDHPAAQSLAHVRPGQLVWLTTVRYPGAVPERSLVPVTHTSQRIYICSEASGKWKNWRYGFDTLTGKAFEYRHSIMSYADVNSIYAEIDAVESRIKEDKRVRSIHVWDHIQQEYAAAMWQALYDISGCEELDQANEIAANLLRQVRKSYGDRRVAEGLDSL